MRCEGVGNITHSETASSDVEACVVAAKEDPCFVGISMSVFVIP